ncbi:MAG: hypothetical protein HC893_15475 [Chloroflexaceae bacterium]|nr:hypothetical protein [Chloroflexaceae bacterium]NJL34986.1 hypothetical protein [Chloroflexaceae bacterium]NJO04362.1 hypothetical protein [Chloroflexaceae bacterium]
MWKNILGLALLAGVAFLIFRAVQQYRQDNVFDMAPAAGGAAGGIATNGQKRGISPELLQILADPADKGPVKLITDSSGKEWLLNPRNGYRYPVEDGIPIMLIEEGEKHKDESLIEKAS